MPLQLHLPETDDQPPSRYRITLPPSRPNVRSRQSELVELATTGQPGRAFVEAGKQLILEPLAALRRPAQAVAGAVTKQVEKLPRGLRASPLALLLQQAQQPALKATGQFLESFGTGLPGAVVSAPIDPATYLFGLTGSLRSAAARGVVGAGIGGGLAAVEPGATPASTALGAVIPSILSAVIPGAKPTVKPRGLPAVTPKPFAVRPESQFVFPKPVSAKEAAEAAQEGLAALRPPRPLSPQETYEAFQARYGREVFPAPAIGKAGFVALPEEATVKQAGRVVGRGAVVGGVRPPALPPSEGVPIPEVPLPKYAPINLNLERLNTSDEIKQSMVTWSQRNKQVLAEDYARFSKGDFKQRLHTEALQDGVDVETLVQKGNYNINTPAGQQELLRDVQALRQVNVGIEQAKQPLRALLDDVNVDALTKQAATSDLLRLEAQQLAVRVSGQRRAQFAGQLLNFFKELAGPASPAAVKVHAMQQLLQRRLGMKPEVYQQFVTATQQLALDNPNQVADFLQEVAVAGGAKNSDLLWEYFYANLLSGLPSHEANFVGNSLKLASEALVIRPAATTGEYLAALVQGRPAQTTVSGLKAYYRGLTLGARKGTQAALNVMRRGFDPQELGSPDKWSAFRFEKFATHPNPVIRKLSPIVNVFSRALKASDAFFRSTLAEADFQSRLVDKAAKMGGNIRDNVQALLADLPAHPDLRLKPAAYAAYGTFNELPGKYTQAFMGLVSKVPALRFLTPFVRISANLAKQGFGDYTPLAAIKLLRNAEGIDRLQRAEAIGRATMGSLLLLRGAAALGEDRLTLEAPTDPAERDQFFRSGKQPYSLRIGTQWIPMQRFAPLTFPYFAGAIIANAYRAGQLNDSNAGDVIVRTSTDVGRFMVNQSYLSGVQNFTRMWERGVSGERQVEKFAAGVASSFVPASSLLRNVTQYLDTTIRKPETFSQFIQAGLPGLSQNVPPRLTVFGQPVQRPGGSLGAFSFLRPSQETTDPLTQELESVGVEVGFPSRTLKGQKLTVTEYNDFLRQTGPLIEQALRALIAQPDYDRLSLSQRRELMESSVKIVSAQVRKDVRTSRSRFVLNVP